MLGGSKQTNNWNKQISNYKTEENSHHFVIIGVFTPNDGAHGQTKDEF